MGDKTQVKIPTPESDKPPMRTVGLLATIGLVLGLAWPSIAGIHVGPNIPGSKKSKPVPTTAPTALAATSNAIALGRHSPAANVNKAQRVVASSGTIKRCFKKRSRKRIDAAHCGSLRGLDHALLPRLRQLAGCPSALGLRGKLQLAFSIDFNKKEIGVRSGKKSELPGSTVRGIVACAADYIRDVAAEKIPHKFSRYQVYYDLEFYPPGSGPAEKAADQGEEQEAEGERDLAAVTWDTALVRDEPRNGKIVARLVKGTRVKLMGRRRDWFRVKIGNRRGWIYRGALGL